MSETSTANGITQVGTVMVPVADKDRAIAFYCGKLGFEKRTDVTFGGGRERWVEVAPSGAATSLSLVTPREGEPIGIDTRVALSTNDIDADHASLLAAGVDADAEVSRMGDPVPPMLWLRDADANVLLLVEAP